MEGAADPPTSAAAGNPHSEPPPKRQRKTSRALFRSEFVDRAPVNPDDWKHLRTDLSNAKKNSTDRRLTPGAREHYARQTEILTARVRGEQPSVPANTEASSSTNQAPGQTPADSASLVDTAPDRPDPIYSLRVELARLLDRPASEIPPIRVTPVGAPCGAGKYDLVGGLMMVTGKDRNHATEELRTILENFPDINDGVVCFGGFPGHRGPPVSVGDLAVLVELLMLSRCRAAAPIRRQAAVLLVRYLGGDVTLVDEVCGNARVQNFLREHEPQHPLRAFGAAVEATQTGATPTSGSAPATPAMLQLWERVELARLEDELSAIETRKRKREEEAAHEQHRLFAQGYVATLQDLDRAQLPVDAAIRMHCRDACVNFYAGETPGTPMGTTTTGAPAAPPTPSSAPATPIFRTPGTPVSRQICLTNYLQTKGVGRRDLQGAAQRLGIRVAKLARDKYGPDFRAEKKTILCNGQCVETNSWTTEHQELIDRAWEQLRDDPSANSAPEGSGASSSSRPTLPQLMRASHAGGNDAAVNVTA